MPELPEVQTITSDLKNNIIGHKITKTIIAGTYAVHPNTKAFTEATLNQQITNTSRIAKNIIIHLESGQFITIHLAMTGQVLIREPEHKTDKWVRVLFELQSPKAAEAKKHLRFCDMRMFGKVKLLNQAELQELKQKYGPEPIEEATTPEIFLKQLHSIRTNIKKALLEQEIVSGLGNIYATDALFMARIHPETPTKNITLEQATKLLQTSKEILLEGIAHRGSTLGDQMYIDAFGKAGTHQNFFRIYGKNHCPACKTQTTNIKLNGRGTYFCPNCQPKA